MEKHEFTEEELKSMEEYEDYEVDEEEEQAEKEYESYGIYELTSRILHSWVDVFVVVEKLTSIDTENMSLMCFTWYNEEVSWLNYMFMLLNEMFNKDNKRINNFLNAVLSETEGTNLVELESIIMDYHKNRSEKNEND